MTQPQGMFIGNKIINDMEKEFVPYELALKMKALGFDEPCFAFYKDFISKWILMMPTQLTQHEQNNLMSYIEDGLLIDVPTFSQAFRWFREKYGMEHQVTYAGVKGRYNAFTDDWVYDSSGELKEFSYEEAELACLDKLIEFVEGIEPQK